MHKCIILKTDDGVVRKKILKTNDGGDPNTKDVHGGRLLTNV